MNFIIKNAIWRIVLEQSVRRVKPFSRTLDRPLTRAELTRGPAALKRRTNEITLKSKSNENG